jgi:hypothetical protein
MSVSHENEIITIVFEIKNRKSTHCYASLKFGSYAGTEADIAKTQTLANYMVEGETGILEPIGDKEPWICFFPNRKPGSFFSYEELSEFDKKGSSSNTKRPSSTEMHFVQMRVLSPGTSTPPVTDEDED